MVDLAKDIWADGPGANPYEPEKYKLRAWGTRVEQNAHVTPQVYGATGAGEAGSAAAILAAIDAVPTGGTLYFPKGRYRSPGYWPRSDIRYVGEKMPSYKGDYSGLENGAIIEGASILSGDNISVENLGFDHGATVAAAVTGMPSEDALVIHDQGLAAIRKNITVRNVIGICEATTTEAHAVLLEGLQASYFENVNGCYGFFPIVIKAYSSKASGLSAIRAGDTGVYFKSDSYAPCREMEVTNVSYEDQGVGADQGVGFYAATESMLKMTVSNIRISGGVQGLKVIGASRVDYPDNALTDCVFSGINCYNQDLQQIYLIGALAGVRVENFIAAFSGSGQCVVVDNNAYAVELNNGYCVVTTPAAANCYFAGATKFNNITVCQTNDLTALGGITYAPDASRPYGIGSYIANLNLNTNGSALLNGWTAAFSDTPRVRVEENAVFMAGRVAVPSTPWTGKENFYQLAIAPKANRQVTASAYRSSGAVVPVTVTINTSGVMSFVQLNTSAAFPTDVTYVMLDGVSFKLQ